MNTQTLTDVHDEASRERQMRREEAAQGALLLGLGVGAQVLAQGALTLLPRALNASWWAVLLQLIPLTALWTLGRGAQGAGRRYRAAAAGMALLFLTDMAADLFSLAELAHVFLAPQAPRWTLALGAAGAAALAAPGRGQGVPRAARFLRWFLLAGLAFCICTVLPTGEAGFLYPLAGWGAGHTLRCALPMTGAVWSAAALPFLPAGREHAAALAPAARCTVLAGVFFFACAYVLPATALSAGGGFAMRLQLLMEMSPHTLSWSLMLLSEVFLFLTALAGAGSFLQACLRRALGGMRAPVWPFLLACLPPAVLGTPAGSGLLMAVLPWRGLAAAALLGIARWGGKGGKPCARRRG